jgi:peptidylprolyl isomerase
MHETSATVIAILLSLAAATSATSHASTSAKPLPAPKPLSAPAQAIGLVDGMSYVVSKPAPAGAKTISAEFVEYRLSAWSADGKTRLNGQADGVQMKPVRLLAQSWPALARALLLTPIGETRRWWFSAERMRGAWPGSETQAHVLELTVLGNADPVPVPPDVGAPPPDVTVTASGLAYRILKRGTRNDHPAADGVIEIDYSGWTRDGKLFDSSVHRGERARFPLKGLIAGWQEGLQLMSPGDSFRFWIPGRLAYDGIDRPGTPKGMLVFDVTLHAHGPAPAQP